MTVRPQPSSLRLAPQLGQQVEGAVDLPLREQDAAEGQGGDVDLVILEEGDLPAAGPVLQQPRLPGPARGRGERLGRALDAEAADVEAGAEGLDDRQPAGLAGAADHLLGLVEGREGAGEVAAGGEDPHADEGAAEHAVGDAAPPPQLVRAAGVLPGDVEVVPLPLDVGEDGEGQARPRADGLARGQALGSDLHRAPGEVGGLVQPPLGDADLGQVALGEQHAHA